MLNKGRKELLPSITSEAFPVSAPSVFATALEGGDPGFILILQMSKRRLRIKQHQGTRKINWRSHIRAHTSPAAPLGCLRRHLPHCQPSPHHLPRSGPQVFLSGDAFLPRRCSSWGNLPLVEARKPLAGPERHPVSALKEVATRGRCWSVFLQPPAQAAAKKQQ